jgi:RNA polymerase sigma-70 factor, ECF subfamily
VDTEDQSLITRITQREQEALRCLYEKYRQRLYEYLWRQLNGNQSEAEDALQEIFLAVWRGAEKFRGDAQVITWIFQIAHFHIRHILRKQHRYDILSLSEDTKEEDVITDLPGPISEETILNHIALNEALLVLTSKHREAIELVYYHGFTLEEVARILDLPIGTVKSRLSYARRMLSQAMHAVASEEEVSS